VPIGVALLAAVVSGVLAGIAFPPVDVGPVALMALVPLLWVWREAAPGRAALAGFAFGVSSFAITLAWSRYFGVVAIGPLVVGEAAFIAAVGALVAAFARRGVRSPWLVAAVWVMLEALRARFPFGGLPWGELGVALHDQPWARALASVGGVPLVSFLVVAGNALLLDLGIAIRGRAVRAGALAAGGLAVIVLATACVDVVRFTPERTGRIRFALLQGNDQNRTLTPSEVATDFLFRRHLALARRLRGHYDLVVFPESSLERDPTTNPDVRNALVDIARARGATVLANARVPSAGGGLANANVGYGPDGRLQGIYAKQHLVPFGEYVPWRRQLSFIGELDQVPFDYEAGRRRVMFRAAGHPFGSVICFESAFAPLVRGYVRDGAELLVVSTNNRSYRRSGLAAQHVALSQMRAAETARPVLHASISGISAVVDPGGAVRTRTALFERAVTRGWVDTVTGDTPYVVLGDWVVAASGLILVAAAIAGVFRRRDNP
jgi:apolipoprotein N-acyltransferase